MKFKTVGVLSVTALVAIAVCVPSASYAEDSSSDTAGIEIPALPQTLTAAEMDEISGDGELQIVYPAEELNELLQDTDLSLEVPLPTDVDVDVDADAARTPSARLVTVGYRSTRPIEGKLSINQTVPTANAGDKCMLSSGRMWSRSSGNGYPYGTVGSKPQLYSCTPGVTKTGMQSDVYRWNGWNWERVAGTFNSYGTGNMQQLSVQYICRNKSRQTYKVVTTGWGTNSKGQTGVGREETDQTAFSCG